MNILKRTAGIIVSLIIAASVIAVPTAASAAEETTDLTLNRFDGYTYVINKQPGYMYDYKVTDNGSKAVKVNMDSFHNKKNWVYIAAVKKTGSEKPKVEIYKESKATGEKTTLVKYKITVKNYKKSNFGNFGTVKISKGKSKSVLIKCKSSYAYTAAAFNTGNYYTIKFKNKKIASLYYVVGNSEENKQNTEFCFIGKKNGTTTGDVYITGTKVKIGKIKIKVGNYKAKLDPRFKKMTDTFSEHGHTGHYILCGSAYILNVKSNAKYTFKAADSNVVTLKKVYTDKNGPNYKVITKKPGNTKIKVYEKIKNKKKTKLGVINYTVKKATMAQIFSYNTWENAITDGDDIIDRFCSEEIFLSKEEKSFDLMKEIDTLVLNHKEKCTSFSKNDYTITFYSTDPDVFTIYENGMINAAVTYDEFISSGKYKKSVTVDFGFNIKFTDGSSYNGIFYLEVM